MAVRQGWGEMLELSKKNIYMMGREERCENKG